MDSAAVPVEAIHLLEEEEEDTVEERQLHPIQLIGLIIVFDIISYFFKIITHEYCAIRYPIQHNKGRQKPILFIC